MFKMLTKEEIKCKRCGKRLSSNDYLSDYYGFCEDGCQED